MIDYGLVTRAACACGDVIIVASNARPETMMTTIRRHNARARHRAYYGDPVVADTTDGDSLGFSPAGPPRSGPTPGERNRSATAGIHLPATEASPHTLDAYEDRLRR